MDTRIIKIIMMTIGITYPAFAFGIGLLNNRMPLRQITPQDLSIVWLGEDDGKKKQEEDLHSETDVCERFKTYLESGRNNWAPFQRISCFDNKSADWQLAIKKSPKKITIQLWRLQYSRKKFDSISLVNNEKTMETLDDDFMVYLISVWIKDLLPFAFQLRSSNFKPNNYLIKDRIHLYSKAYSIPYPPNKMIIYKAQSIRRNGYYLANPIGSALLQQNIAILQPQGKVEKAEQTTLEISWKIQMDHTKLPSAKSYLLAQNSRGSSVFNKRVKQTIGDYYRDRSADDSEELYTKLSKSLSDFFIGEIKVGYFGVRYGFPILKDESSLFIDKMRFFGFLAEFRSGLLKGFTFHLDLWPQILEPDANGEFAEFGGHRFIFGYKFLFNIDYFASNFHITPKIGGWTFKTSLPLALGDGQNEYITFKTDNDLSLGLSGGFEFIDRYFMIDLWASKTVSIPSSSPGIPEAASVSTQNIGIDGYYSLGSFKISKTNIIPSLMLFSFFEETLLTKSNTSISVASDIQSIKFEQAFYGLGLAVSW